MNDDKKEEIKKINLYLSLESKYIPKKKIINLLNIYQNLK